METYLSLESIACPRSAEQMHALEISEQTEL
jgi:hypothetical protein